MPLTWIVRDTIAHGDLPLWNPYLSGGQPMAANPAYEVFYPLQWLTFLGSFTFGFACTSWRTSGWRCSACTRCCVPCRCASRRRSSAPFPSVSEVC